MKLFLHEITDQETLLEFSQEDAWVLNAVQSVDERSEELAFLPPKRPIHASLNLRKVDEIIVISGKIETYIKLVCSRCAQFFQFTCTPRFSALFCKDPVMAGVAYLQKQGTDHREAGRPRGQNSGFARHAHNSEDDELISEGKDLDITYLSHDYIDLSEVLAEQLQLQIPFQPLCKEECHGICSLCGTDLNQGRCACAKIKSNPFSILSDLKI